jgi:aryl-alcohol dehydrogenase-like predicted oxidoreductase
LCRAEQVAAVTYSPLGAGFLTGKYAPGAAFPRGSRFDVSPGHAEVYFSPRNFRVVERLRSLAEATGVPAARLAVGWVLRNPDVTSVLVGARATGHLDNALEAHAMVFPAEWAAEMAAWA